MTSNHQLIPGKPDPNDSLSLDQQLRRAHAALLEAEARLAEEQAAVNAFRMHCRLKLDQWINTLVTLQTKKQRLLTELELERQAHENGLPYDADDPFWQTQHEDPTVDDELILPTDTPRDKAAEKRIYRRLVRKFHPDLGQTAAEVAYRTEMMTAVNAAYERQDVQAMFDLAVELDPDEMAELARITALADRRKREQILRLRRRRRKAIHRLSFLRQENTARLWQKAQELERRGVSDTHWWEVVRREIETAIGRVQQDVADLTAHLAALEKQDEAQPSAG
ncbi:MAG: J domain-containing protein [Candidatus Promineifilaceae bacterium]|nr:J domain-containing protein [Candidatus Promineifilaceae bacterium]